MRREAAKEKLFRAVLEGAYEKLGQAEEQLHLADTPPLEGMRQLIAFTWDYYYRHLEFIRLLDSENQYRGQHLKKSKSRSRLAPLLGTFFRQQVNEREVITVVFEDRLLAISPSGQMIASAGELET